MKTKRLLKRQLSYWSFFLRNATWFVLLAILSYGSFVGVGGYILKEESQVANYQNQESHIYVTSNGLHTDIVVPITQDFFQRLNDTTLLSKYQNYRYASIGWGDKDFFNESYNGNFPCFETCFKAMFLPSPTLMHVNFYKNPLQEDENCIKIGLSQKNYEFLLQHIFSSFRKDKTQGIVIRLPQKGYTQTDYFFEANGNYSLFYTCNSWTNDALKQANLAHAAFTPFASTIMYHLQQKPNP